MFSYNVAKRFSHFVANEYKYRIEVSRMVKIDRENLNQSEKCIKAQMTGLNNNEKIFFTLPKFLQSVKTLLKNLSWGLAWWLNGRRRIRDRKLAGSPLVYALPRNNIGQVVYMHVPLSTKQYKLVPALAGT